MQTIHDVVVDTLNYFGKPTDISLIYEHITKNELYSFGAKKEDPQHIVKNLIERKCINSNASYKTKQLLFYKEGTRKYGLLEWLEESDKVDILESFHKAQFQNIESKLDEVESKLGVEKINELVNQNILKIDEHAKKQSELLKEQLTNNFHNNTLKIENLITSFRLETEKIKKDFDVEILNKENEIDKKINEASKQFEEEVLSLKNKVSDNLSEEYDILKTFDKKIYLLKTKNKLTSTTFDSVQTSFLEEVNNMRNYLACTHSVFSVKKEDIENYITETTKLIQDIESTTRWQTISDTFYKKNLFKYTDIFMFDISIEDKYEVITL
ncbi:MAG: hypothetical protein M0R46_17255 [Candidatus Muirbacterium halophilum]|nr:hypothetical protein [Candidatus Muirbacterium halophilum]